MKKLILVAFVLLCNISIAQSRKSIEMTPEQVAEIQTKKMTLDLDLSSNQQKDVKALLLEEAKKREAVKKEMNARSQEEKKISSDEKYKKQIEILDNQIELKAKMKKILNPEQMAKWEEKQNQRKAKIDNARRKAKKHREEKF
jgi:hypothetical protein